MRRLNFLEDEPWDEVDDKLRRRVRWFGHPFGADMLGASLHELLPGTPGGPLHMHYGVEEMFFVLAGTPAVRTPEGEERLTPGDVVYFPEGADGLHDFFNPTNEPARLLAISTKRFPDVVAYPERGVGWVATRHPERPIGEGGDKGIIARFELPSEDSGAQLGGHLRMLAQARDYLGEDRCMPVDVTTEIEIDRPRAEVAGFAAIPDNAPRWYENIESVEWMAEHRLAVGARVAFVARFLGRRLVYTYEIETLVPGERLVMATREGPFPMETTYTWADTAEGGTRMTLRNRGEPTGFSRIGGPVMAAAMRRANRKDLAKLKRILESASVG